MSSLFKIYETPVGNLNENLDAEKIFEYIWFTETGKKFEKILSENKYYLGEFDGAGIYFNYEKNSRGKLFNLC